MSFQIRVLISPLANLNRNRCSLIRQFLLTVANLCHIIFKIIIDAVEFKIIFCSCTKGNTVCVWQTGNLTVYFNKTISFNEMNYIYCIYTRAHTIILWSTYIWSELVCKINDWLLVPVVISVSARAASHSQLHTPAQAHLLLFTSHWTYYNYADRP